MRIHELKTWREFFESMSNGEKKFEYRLNDRNFSKGDILHLREWDNLTLSYTGRELFEKIDFIWPISDQEKSQAQLWNFPVFVMAGYVIMSVSLVTLTITEAHNDHNR